MKPYISIDLETTGLNPNYCQILEIGAVVDDWVREPAELPVFHAYIVHERIVGEAYGLAMNRDILVRLSTPGDPRVFLKPVDVGHYFGMWLLNHYGEASRVVAAGKNFASFDLQFLNKLPTFQERVTFHHRSIDPAMLYWNPETDDVPPSTAQCLARAGLPTDVKHTAIDDALQVVQLVRHWFRPKFPT